MSLATAYLDGLNRTTIAGYSGLVLAGAGLGKTNTLAHQLAGFSGRPCLYAVFRLEAALPFRQLGLQPPSGSVLGAKFPDQYLVSLDLQSASCASLSHPISIGPYFTAVLGFRHVHPFLTDPAQLFAFYRSPTPLRKRSAA